MNPDRFKDRYVHHRNLLGRGAIELGAVLGASWTTDAVRNLFSLPKSWTLPVFFGLLVLEYLIGWLYWKKKLLAKDYQWHTSQDANIGPLIKSVHMVYERVAKHDEDMKKRHKLSWIFTRK